MADLRVEPCGELVGHLDGADCRTFDFVTGKNAIDTFVRLESPIKSASAGLQDDIAGFTRNLLDGRPTGDVN